MAAANMRAGVHRWTTGAAASKASVRMVAVTIPSEPPFAYAELFRLDRSRLLDMLRSLPVEEWQRPTPCPGWDVLGLVNHLVGADLSVLAWQRDDHRGTPAPSGLDEAGFIAWLDELQIEWVHAARRISPRLATELLGWLGDAVADMVADQDATSRTANVSWASTTPVPVWLDQARELTERWIHRQQLLEAIGNGSDLDETLAGPVLDALRWAYPFRLNAATLDHSLGGVEIVIAEPFARVWHLTIDTGNWSFTDRLDGAPAVTLNMTVEQAWRLLTNNYRAQDHGDIATEGDSRTVRVLTDTRAIIGDPK